MPPAHLRASPTTLSAAAIIREARLRADLTQVQLATRAGVTQSAISTYENGRREPSLALLQRLLLAAGFRTAIDLQPVAEPAPHRGVVALPGRLSAAPANHPLGDDLQCAEAPTADVMNDVGAAVDSCATREAPHSDHKL